MSYRMILRDFWWNCCAMSEDVEHKIYSRQTTRIATSLIGVLCVCLLVTDVWGQDPNQEESEEQEEQQDPTGSGDQDAQEAEKSEQQGEAEPLNRQNIEAILQSLEDQDKQEQKNLRRSKAAPTARGNKWW